MKPFILITVLFTLISLIPYEHTYASEPMKDNRDYCLTLGEYGSHDMSAIERYCEKLLATSKKY